MVHGNINFHVNQVKRSNIKQHKPTFGKETIICIWIEKTGLVGKIAISGAQFLGKIIINDISKLNYLAFCIYYVLTKMTS